MRLTRASVRAEKAARTPARTVRPAQPRRSSDPAREPAAALGAGFAPPLNASDGRLGQLALFVAAFGIAFAFAAVARSVAAETRAKGEDRDPPPARPG